LIAALPENPEITGGSACSGIAFHPTESLLAAVTPNGNEFRILHLSTAA
jgi:hypothetical protein